MKSAQATIQITKNDILETMGVLTIIRDLVAFDPDDRAGHCVFCGVAIGCEEDGWEHPDDCLHKRAVRAFASLMRGEDTHAAT